MTQILDIDWHCEVAGLRMHLGQPLEQAHPRLHTSSFADSAVDLKHSMNWMWLQTHKGRSQHEMSQVVVETVKRALPFYGAVSRELYRDKHDYLLLSAAILAGDQYLTSEAAKLVRIADVHTELPNYFRSLSGILKFMLAGDQALAKEQFEVLSACKGKETDIRAAKKSVLKAFITGDVKDLRRQVNGVAQDFWKRLKQSTDSAVQDPRGNIKLGTSWDVNRFWPWPEAAVLKIMSQRGTDFETDEFWLPAKLISGKD